MKNTANSVIGCLTLWYWHEKQREECHVFCNTTERVCGQATRERLSERTCRTRGDKNLGNNVLNFLVLGKESK